MDRLPMTLGMGPMGSVMGSVTIDLHCKTLPLPLPLGVFIALDPPLLPPNFAIAITEWSLYVQLMASQNWTKLSTLLSIRVSDRAKGIINPGMWDMASKKSRVHHQWLNITQKRRRWF